MGSKKIVVVLTDGADIYDASVIDQGAYDQLDDLNEKARLATGGNLFWTIYEK